jgi:hypothetical protein
VDHDLIAELYPKPLAQHYLRNLVQEQSMRSHPVWADEPVHDVPGSWSRHFVEEPKPGVTLTSEPIQTPPISKYSTLLNWNGMA